MKNKLALLAFLLSPLHLFAGETLSLNGSWEYGIAREYCGTTAVPGLVLDPTVPGPAPLWYRRTVTLPEGTWTDAELELKGARFRPRVYVDGTLVSAAEGGMTRTLHRLTGTQVRPGTTIVLEIELASLKDVPREDASYIPEVDQWRSNCSSCLWDDVVLHLYHGARVDRVLPDYRAKSRTATLKYRVRGSGAATAEIVLSAGGKIEATLSGSAAEGDNEVTVDCAHLQSWSPASPVCYDLRIRLRDIAGDTLSEYTQTVGFREFRTDGKQFVLNGRPFTARGGSVVWHRWIRDEDARELAFDTVWFKRNILQRIKERGGNYIRFHLGVPPERILDLCDRMGLTVQYEWSFFHGMPASYESLVEQYGNWLDVAFRHPSVCLIHPYNETDEQELATAWLALNDLLPHYPDVVLEDRDVLHIHRYWWGMSENLGLYFDSYRQFVKPVVVDEFGGVYLDRNGDMGGYPMIPKGMKRWLGANHTAGERLRQQVLASGKVGEYWRRIGVAGIGVFPLASSFEDGNNWFSGDLREGRPKPVWDAMTAVWSDRSVSLELWDCNFTPGERIRVPAHFINDGDDDGTMTAVFAIRDAAGRNLRCDTLSRRVAAHNRRIEDVIFDLPAICGEYELSATLLNPLPNVTRGVVSAWEIRVVEARPSERLLAAKIHIPACERELRTMARNQGLHLVAHPGDADLIVLGQTGFERIDNWREALDAAVLRGASVVMLSVGNRTLGKSYVDGARNLGQVSGAPKLLEAEIRHTELFAGISVNSVEVAEPESHLHPTAQDTVLWAGLKPLHTRLWNGLRGGLIVPASNLEIEGLSQEAFLAKWTAVGADAESIRSGTPCYAYEYCGFYRFDTRPDNADAERSLRQQVAFLIEDMPALALSLPQHTPVRVIDLSAGYRSNHDGRASGFRPLASSGKDLLRTPVTQIFFGPGEGSLILSQLITEGRLAKGYAPRRKSHRLKYDEAAVQFVLNMFDTALSPKPVNIQQS